MPSSNGPRVRGKVKWFSAEKGYGFITQQDGPDLFVHWKAIQADGFKTLEADQAVEFTPVEGTKGPAAEEVVAL